MLSLNLGSKRIKNFTESVIREQTRWAQIYGAINLAQGFPDFPCSPEIKRLANRAVNRNFNQYSITWGMPALRKQVSQKLKRYNRIIADSEKNITITCGATEAMICAFLALLDPGKEVIIFQPFYENYHPDALMAGVTARYVTLHEPNWTFDEAELKKAFCSKSGAIIINTPHNPTGKIFSRAELEFISNLCQKWGVMVFTDEIYEHILFDKHLHISPAAIPGLEDLTVTIGSASKTYAVTGWRVGWIAAPEKLMKSIRKVHDFLTVCAPTPLQEAVKGALALKSRFYQEVAEFYQKKRDLIINGLQQAGFTCYIPQGAYYVMAEIPLNQKKSWDDKTLASSMVKKLGVAVVPGSSFYAIPKYGRKKLRFCFCKKDGTIREALKRIKKGLENNHFFARIQKG